MNKGGCKDNPQTRKEERIWQERFVLTQGITALTTKAP